MSNAEAVSEMAGTPEVADGAKASQDLMLVVSFADPDGNGWIVQEITNRRPGR
jgi:hypothetical protein